MQVSDAIIDDGNAEPQLRVVMIGQVFKGVEIGMVGFVHVVGHDVCVAECAPRVAAAWVYLDGGDEVPDGRVQMVLLHEEKSCADDGVNVGAIVLEDLLVGDEGAVRVVEGFLHAGDAEPDGLGAIGDGTLRGVRDGDFGGHGGGTRHW